MKSISLTIAAFAVAGVLAGCGKAPDDGIASASDAGTQQTSTQVSDNPEERARQFAQCMRDQGIDMPDPEFSEDGGFRVRVGGPGEAGGDGIAPREDMTKFREAMQACQKYMPNGGEMMRNDPEMQEKMREFAKCMRENGIENFPDPQEGGGIIIGGPNSEGGLNIDPSDPAFQEAQKKCQQFLPEMRRRVTG